MEIPDSPAVQQQLAPHARVVRELAGRVVGGLKQVCVCMCACVCGCVGGGWVVFAQLTPSVCHVS
jgi:hypothetical protein